MTELLNAAATFNADTKKMFKSCTFAALNIYGNRSDWNAWGDFKNRNHAIAAMRMWTYAFKGKANIEIVDNNKYRVIVAIK